MSVAIAHGSMRDVRQSRRQPWHPKYKIDQLSPPPNIINKSTPPTTQTQQANMKKIHARNEDGLIIFSGLSSSDPASLSTMTISGSINNQSPAELTQSQQSSKNVPSVALSFVESRSASPDIEDEGPNSNGTYSREYTLKHPEITWVHRGQGRYRPEQAISESSQKTPTASQEQDFLVPDYRKSLRSRTSNASEDDSLDTRSEARHLSPRATRLSDTPYSLRRRQSDQGPNASELREARSLRRANPSTSGDSQSTETIEEESSGKTYAKSYVEAHPEMQFKHCGNGFYRRLSASQNHLGGSRRNSSRSFTKSDASPSDASQTIHSSELKNFPGEKFKHCGNGYYRRESAVSQNTNTSSTAVTDRSMSPSNGTESLTKEQVQEYRVLHPDAVFVHRGNGRYKRADDDSPQPKTTYDKAYVDAHPDESFYHCGSGRYRRGQRTPRPSDISSNEKVGDLGLVTKQYVEEHPELVFHHRGQGRWAPGPRPATSRSPTEEEPKLVDRDYVDAHPDETFHHRGQGRWARGLPPPGSSNKMAVRGPGAHDHKETITVPPLEMPHLDNVDMPGVYDLVRKEQGPEAWPQLTWHYRGGGKWSRTTKEEVDAIERQARNQRKSRMQTDVSEHDTQTDADSLATNSRRGSLQTLAAPALKRKHSALQSSDINEADSKDSTPRPKMLTLEEDKLSEEDLPELFGEEWSLLDAEEEIDDAAQILRQNFRPLNEPDDFIRMMTKLDLAIRPTETLYTIAAHVQAALQQMQDEYLELDKITAPHARIPRKVATGGRLPVDSLAFEDRKEADLYDYQFDPKKIGHQDPEAQKINRDVDGRELRKRRKRGEVDADVLPEAPLPRRIIKPVEKFEGMPGSTRRSRLVDASKQSSVTPDRVLTPEKIKTTPDLHAWAESYIAPKSGRWANHIPKRIRELRGGSLGPGRPEIIDDTATSADEDDSLASVKTTPTKPAPDVIDSIEDKMELDEPLLVEETI